LTMTILNRLQPVAPMFQRHISTINSEFDNELSFSENSVQFKLADSMGLPQSKTLCLKEEVYFCSNWMPVVLVDIVWSYLPPESKTNLPGKYHSEWKYPNLNSNFLNSIVHDNQHLYMNCFRKNEIYCYSFHGNLIKTFKHHAYAIDLVHHQFYLLSYPQFLIIDILTNSLIQSWNYSITGDVSYGFLKVDQENICFTLGDPGNYVYLYSKNGKEIKKFGSKGEKEGQFHSPSGVTVNENYLYICDRNNHRLQVLDKKNGNFICQWKVGQRSLQYPYSNLLYENLLYVGDLFGIQVFTNEGKFIQIIGRWGYKKKGEFDGVVGLCIVNDQLYINDANNARIQVWDSR